jgi:aerobic carbon-monoxide dehydrogenase small subunit
MRTVRLTVNGRMVTASAEPRTHLADFLRESQLLTGTHLGCEHGVCGACTLLIDGAPARSCITYAIACEGAEVTTIEGLDDDEVTGELRAAFSREHGVQCGYCTPGMLMTARDIVTRLPDADERRVRLELSGNLCRCTGYVGIVRAICAVLDERCRSGATTEQVHRHSLGPVGSGHALPIGPGELAGLTTVAPSSGVTFTNRSTGQATDIAVAPMRPGSVLRQSFTVDHPRERVFAFFGQLDEVVTCMPGAALTAVPRDDHVQGQLHIKLGPIAAAFAGEADIERDPTNHRGVIRGRGRDLRTGSTVVGEVSYVLVEEGAGAATRVDVEVGYALRGALAQVGRSRIVNDLAERLTAVFAKNIEARLSGGADSSNGVAAPQAELDVGALILAVIRARIRRVFERLLGR